LVSCIGAAADETDVVAAIAGAVMGRKRAAPAMAKLKINSARLLTEIDTEFTSVFIGLKWQVDAAHPLEQEGVTSVYFDNCNVTVILQCLVNFYSKNWQIKAKSQVPQTKYLTRPPSLM
jgi:hypothetical protein